MNDRKDRPEHSGRPHRASGSRPGNGERKPSDGERKPYNGKGGRSGGGDRKPYRGDRSQDGERRPYRDDRSQDGERRPYRGDRQQDGERRPYRGDRPSDGERKPYRGDRPDNGERKPYRGERQDRGERRPSDGDRKPYRGDRAQDGERRPYRGDRAQDGERRPYRGDRPSDGERRPYRDDRRSTDGERRPYRGDRAQDGERRPYRGDRQQDGERRSYRADGDRKPYRGDRSYSGDRKPHSGDRKPYSGDRAPFRDSQGREGRGGTRGGGRSDRGGQAREYTEEERLRHSLRPVRSEHDDPVIADRVDARDLHPSARNELKTLQAEVQERVAKHLAMVALLIDEDPELAHQHAISASRRAGRIPVVRETLAMTAYRTGDYALAIRELRTFRRLSGRDTHVAIMVDSERGLGRPEKAIETGLEADRSTLDTEGRVHLAIAMSGARLDLGQTQQALFELEIPELDPEKAFSWSPELFGAYATVLEDLGRDAEAAEWFERADRADAALEDAFGGQDELEVIEIHEHEDLVDDEADEAHGADDRGSDDAGSEAAGTE